MNLLRSLIFTAAFYSVSAIAAIGLSPLMLGPRSWSMGVMAVWSRVVTWLLRVICDVKVEVRGWENLPKGGALIAAKHQCMFDIFGTLGILPDGCFVLKKELLRIPFFGWWALRSRMIVVDREGHSAALKKLVKDSKDRMTDQRQLVIFPEGTRRHPGEVGDYKPGIAALYRELEMPVTPLALNTGVHWAPRGITMQPGTIVFEFLPPIPPGLKRGEFMRQLEGAIEPACQRLLDEGL
ncbi:lysophospholipid acyltransferase family protein [Caulobacter sp. SLTY]|uniref:lysophospholipid acyltransferase family protein n=1 Tax=Caulobacter sp. SLTY TaxID=2683262 RepID=UPI003211D381